MISEQKTKGQRDRSVVLPKLVGFFSGGLVVAAGSNGTIYPYLIRFDSIHRRTNLLYGKVQTIKK